MNLAELTASARLFFVSIASFGLGLNDLPFGRAVLRGTSGRLLVGLRVPPAFLRLRGMFLGLEPVDPLNQL